MKDVFKKSIDLMECHLERTTDKVFLREYQLVEKHIGPTVKESLNRDLEDIEELTHYED